MLPEEMRLMARVHDVKAKLMRARACACEAYLQNRVGYGDYWMTKVRHWEQKERENVHHS